MLHLRCSDVTVRILTNKFILKNIFKKSLRKTYLDDAGFHVIIPFVRKRQAKNTREHPPGSTVHRHQRAITKEQCKDIKDLLPYMPPIYQKYFKSLKTQNPASNQKLIMIIKCELIDLI